MGGGEQREWREERIETEGEKKKGKKTQQQGKILTIELPDFLSGCGVCVCVEGVGGGRGREQGFLRALSRLGAPVFLIITLTSHHVSAHLPPFKQPRGEQERKLTKQPQAKRHETLACACGRRSKGGGGGGGRTAGRGNAEASEVA